MRRSIAGISGATLIAAVSLLAQFDPQSFRLLLWGVVYVGIGILVIIGLSYLLPRPAKRILQHWQIRDGSRYQSIAYPLQGGQGPVIEVALTEPRKFRTDSLGSFSLAIPKLREQAVQLVIGGDVFSPSYRVGKGWLSQIPDDFEDVPVEIGTYEAQWMVEGVPTVTHRFEWDGQTTHTKLSLIKRIEAGLSSVLRWISSL